jgi:hypothetical protein
LYDKAVNNPPGAWDQAVVNSRRWRAAEIPAVNGHGTAVGVCELFVALLGSTLLSRSLRREMSTVHCSGTDAVMGGETAWGLGVAIDADGFGMGGTGGSLGWASLAGGYAYGFVTGTAGTHERCDIVENALRGCLGLPPLE